MSFIIPLGAANKKIGSVSSGLVSAELNAAKTEFTYTYTDGSVLKVPVTQPPLDTDLVEEKVDEYLDEHKDDIKGEPGEDGKSVQVLSTTETEADIATETVLAFSLAETTSDNESYTKTQSDVKYAKSVEVGNTSTIVVPDVNTLVKAINKVWLAGLDHMALDSTTKTLNLVTRAGVVVPFDISQIILNTNIEEFKNVLVTNILDGQSLVYSASKQKWINKSIDSSGMLVEAKAYTDDEIKKINNKGQLAVDEKPTYYGGVITYKKGGVTKTTENVGTWFYYLDADGKATQTIFIDGTEFTIAMAGEINLDDYIAQTEKLAVYDENFVDKTKVPTTAYMEEFKSAIDEDLADKVNVADIEDTLTSDSDTKVLSAKQGKALKSAIDGLIDDTADSTVENKTYSAKKISEAIDGVNPSWNGTKAEYDALDKSTLKDGQTVNITDDYEYNPFPIGIVFPFAGTVTPTNFLLCDGSAISKALYPLLYAVIGDTYNKTSVADGYFNLPDYRECSLVGVGQNDTNTITSHDVFTLGQFKDDQLQGHYHNTYGIWKTDGTGGYNSLANDANTGEYTYARRMVSDGTNGTPRIGKTTRGKSMGVNYIIKAK